MPSHEDDGEVKDEEWGGRITKFITSGSNIYLQVAMVANVPAQPEKEGRTSSASKHDMDSCHLERRPGKR